MVEQREKEVLQIVRSIQDLNEIFKDLASLVVDQVGLGLVLCWFCVKLVLLMEVTDGLPHRKSVDNITD